MRLTPERDGKDDDVLISTIGAVQNIIQIQSLEAQIALIEIEQKRAKLDLDIRIEQARLQQSVNLASLDEAAKKLNDVFHPKA